MTLDVSPQHFSNGHAVYMQLIEACNKQERFAHLGGLGINAALLYIEGDTPCSQHVLHTAVASLQAAYGRPLQMFLVCTTKWSWMGTAVAV